jgi:GAF domain-containing protein
VIHISGAARLDAPKTSGAYDALAEAVASALAEHLDRLAARTTVGAARSLRSMPDPEAERQRSLDAMALVAHSSSIRLDRLLRSARELFGTAGAAVTLVDGDQVTCKASIGMELQDVPRTVSPCDRTIRRDGALVLGDLRSEPAGAYGWRFYAGHPLESPDGYRIGALCLLDTRPHDPLTVDRIALAEVAARIEAELWTEAAGTTPPAFPAATPAKRWEAGRTPAAAR